MNSLSEIIESGIREDEEMGGERNEEKGTKREQQREGREGGEERERRERGVSLEFFGLSLCPA